MSTGTNSDVTADTGADDERSTVDVDHSPARASSYAAVVAALLSALTSAPFAVLALPLGLGGVVLVAAGLFGSKNRSYVSFGAAGLFLSTIVSGVDGTPVELLLVSAAMAALAWDVGQNAISVGDQLGRHTTTWRIEAVHASATTVVALLAAAVGYGVSIAASGGQPAAAVGMLSLGLVFLLWAIRT